MDTITPSLVEDITEIRDSGEVNMMDYMGVQVIASRMEFLDLVIWIEDNSDHYMTLLRSI